VRHDVDVSDRHRDVRRDVGQEVARFRTVSTNVAFGRCER
jgi:hypothetical protein